MSSRDGSNRPGGHRPAPQSGREPNPARQPQRAPRTNWDVDPAEIDRYLSGRPSREQESQATSARSRRAPRAAEGTADQLDQLQRARSSQPPQRRPTQQVSPPHRAARVPSVGRQQFIESGDVDDQAYDLPDEDDLYNAPEGAYDDVHEEEDYAPTPARQPRRQAQIRRQPQSRLQRQPAYEDEYDDELYADDPYLSYDDDEDWNVPATRRASRPRPQVKLTKPNLPKLTVPHSISQAELANDIPALAMIGGAILSAAIMAIVVSNRLEVLPLAIPTHVSAGGVPENIQGRNAIWSLPLLATALALMNVAAAWFIARIDMFAARFMLGAALLVQFIAWVAVLKYLWP